MKSTTAIEVIGVGKTFKLPHERYSSLKQTALNVFTKKSYSRFKALQDISFEVKTGEFFGIVGRNGSGKSTLLKMLAGIYIPTTGRVKINGALSPFIELGVGFNPELSARDNVFLNGAILGLTRQQIEEKFNEIIHFAELEEFVDQKLKNFSSGMQVRLAFSIAIQAQADILLVDEVLAVGDSAFQKKCFDVFRRMKKEGRTIVFVTHDMSNVLEFCDRVLVIHDSKTLAITGPDQAADLYNQLNSKDALEEMAELSDNKRWGSREIQIKNVEFIDSSGKQSRYLKTGEPFEMKIELEKLKEISGNIMIGLAFFEADGTHIAGPNSTDTKIAADASSVTYRIDKLPFIDGNYATTVAIYDTTGDKTYDYIDKGFTFSVSGKTRGFGITTLFGKWDSK